MRCRSYSFLIVVLTTALFLAGCGKAQSDPLLGKWRTDLGGENGLMTVVFTEEGTFRTSFSAQPALTSEGTYQILEEDRIEVTTLTPGGTEQTVEMDFRVEDRKLILSQAGESQVFYRLED